MDAPLRARGVLKVGLPGSGSEPFMFHVANTDAGGRGVETIVLKLFVSNIYVDMRHLVQRPVAEVIAVACPEEVSSPDERAFRRVSKEVEICGMALASVVITEGS